MVTKTSHTPLHSYLEYRAWQLDLGEPSWSSSGWLDISLENSVTHDGPVPNYRTLIRQGQNASTFLTGSKQTATLSNDGFLAFEQERDFGFAVVKGRCELRGNLGINSPGPTDPSLFTMTSVRNQTISKFIAKCRAAQTSLKGLVSAGEIGETVRMVNSTGKALMRQTKHYLADLETWGRRLTPHQIARAISGKYLEYAFGVKPLISDIDDGLKGLSRIRDFRNPRVSVRAGAESAEQNPPTDISYVLNRFEVIASYYRRNRYAYKLYGAVGIPNFGLGSFHDEFGFKLDEFVPTIYELIPYSFLVDYFLNLGAVVDAYAFNRASVKWVTSGSMQASDVITDIKSARPVVPDGWVETYRSISTGTPYRRSRILKTRGPYLGDLIPDLEFTIPGAGTKWLNIGALATQAVTTSRKLRKESPY